MKRKTVKNQHYVPRFYLRRFTTDGERLFVFDKIKDEIRGPENIKSVAQEKYFYDLPIDSIPADWDAQAEEKALCALEGQFNTAIEAALRVVDGKGATLHERSIMSWFVTVQILRTRAFRNYWVDVMTTVQEEMMNTLLRVVEPSSAEKFAAKVTYDAGAEASMHAKILWDKELLDTLSSGIFHHIWIVGVNRTGIPLYTSDNPVVMCSHCPKDTDLQNYDWSKSPGLTLATFDLKMTQPHPLEKGVEIIFPLTPECALIMLEREHFAYLQPNQGQVYSLQGEHIQKFNRLQVEQSERQIFGVKNNFESARKFCQETKSQDRERGFELDVQILHQLEDLADGE